MYEINNKLCCSFCLCCRFNKITNIDLVILCYIKLFYKTHKVVNCDSVINHQNHKVVNCDALINHQNRKSRFVILLINHQNHKSPFWDFVNKPSSEFVILKKNTTTSFCEIDKHTILCCDCIKIINIVL